MSDEDWGFDGPQDDREGAAREQRRRERDARRKPPAAKPAPAPQTERRPLMPQTARRSAPAPESSPRRTVPPDPARGRGRRPYGWLAAVAVAVAVAVGTVAVVDRLRGGNDPPPELTLKVENVTIPEGFNRRQVAEIARGAGLRGDYMKASETARGFDPRKYGATEANNLEGFLFPATYELERNTKVEDLVGKQLEAFETNVAGVNMSYARSKNLTVYDVLTIASMIEREVQVPRERKLVAAVIYNRLRGGIPLGIDATTRFAVGNYTTPLTNEQLDSPSPYNTRLVAGLPPGPIGSPGLASIEAAAHPAKVDYLFFVVRPGTCGEHNFSSSETEFERDQAAYQQALEAKGGSPDTC